MTDYSKTLCLFHDADLDGLTCREIARRALPGAVLQGYDYGRPVPDLSPYETVYLMDISLPVEVMREHAAKIVLLDHHKTCLEAVAPFRDHFKGYYCIDGVAACRLTWAWFNGSNACGDYSDLPAKKDYLARAVAEPYAVQLLGEYDVWRRDNPDTDLFQLGMQAQKEPNWLRLLAMPDEITADEWHAQSVYVGDIIEAGRGIQSYLDVTNAQIAKERGFDVQWEGLLFRALNIARCSSLTFTAALHPEHDGCLGYFWDGGKWRFSLYHAPGKEQHDMGAIAKRYGGGGHRGAAGGTFGVLPEALGGPLGHLMQIKLMDTPENRSLFQRFNAGETQLRETFHEFMRPILDEAFTQACGDVRVTGPKATQESTT